MNVLKKLDKDDEMPVLKNQEIKFEVSKLGEKSKLFSRYFLLRIRTPLKKFSEDEKNLSS